tara:strand:- start:10976 stop:11707 length:732 start_codon:yes stop_codon:yes gene_type:complete
MVLWGPSGSGKTTLAATCLRPTLWVNFDVDGTSSLMDQDDIYIADFETMTPPTVEKFKANSCAGIRDALEENPEIKTVVFDSITSFRDKCLLHSVSKGMKSTIEQPGLQGYGMRNTFMYQAFVKVLEVTKAAGVHCIFIAHEAAPMKDEITGQLLVSMLVGGNMNTEIPTKLSEVWYLEDTGKDRRITIRSSRIRKPMKSRMFTTSGEDHFIWNFDPEQWEGDGIGEWYQQWVDNDGKKLELP